VDYIGSGVYGTGWRNKIRAAMRRRVRAWIFGPESVFPGDPRRRVIHDHTSTVDCRVIQYGPNDGEPVRIGRYSGINHTVVILHGGMHHPDWISSIHTYRGDDGGWIMPPGAVHSRGPVVIGSDVLVTYEVLIMSGVTIGDGAIVAPRAVVTKDVEPYSIVGGNPAKHLRFRFDEPTREALLRIKWWDWPDEKVRELRHEINSPDVAAFIARHDPALKRPGAGAAS
jgi:acetyltransferase-like isoleucine patch superfamily enzyme